MSVCRLSLCDYHFSEALLQAWDYYPYISPSFDPHLYNNAASPSMPPSTPCTPALGVGYGALPVIVAVRAAVPLLVTLDKLLLASLDALLAALLALLIPDSLALEIEAAAPVSLAFAADSDADPRLEAMLEVAFMKEAVIELRLELNAADALDTRLETIELADAGSRLEVVELAAMSVENPEGLPWQSACCARAKIARTRGSLRCMVTFNWSYLKQDYDFLGRVLSCIVNFESIKLQKAIKESKSRRIDRSCELYAPQILSVHHSPECG